MPTPIDTTGYVLTTSQFPPPGDGALKLGWSDLDPFTQGYIEALFRGLYEIGVIAPPARTLRFSDLAPEALAMILRDCRDCKDAPGCAPLSNTADTGKMFWDLREARDLPRWPALTLVLGEDGKIHLREAQ